MAVGLTKEQLEKFEKDGLLVIEDFLTSDEVDGLKAEITKIVDEMDPKTDRGVFSTTDNNSKQVSRVIFVKIIVYLEPAFLFSVLLSAKSWIMLDEKLQ